MGSSAMWNMGVGRSRSTHGAQPGSGYRCITIDLPLGAHPWPLSPGADRSAISLAQLLLDCLELLEVHDATVIANDTAGGLLLLSLATGHPIDGWPTISSRPWLVSARNS
jgi:hypothetical protein